MHIERVHRGVRHEGKGTHLGTAHIRLPLGFVWLAKNLWCIHTVHRSVKHNQDMELLCKGH